MQVIQLPDQLYGQARQRASKAGFHSVDAYVADIVASDVSDDLADLGHIFTPEFIAELEQIRAEMDSGKTLSEADVDEYLRRRSQEWRAAHGS